MHCVCSPTTGSGVHLRMFMQPANTLATNQHSTPKQYLFSTVQIGNRDPNAYKGESRPYGQCKNNKQECAAGQVTNWEKTWKETYETLAQAEMHSQCTGCMHKYTFQCSKPSGFGCLNNLRKVACTTACGPQFSTPRQNKCEPHEHIALESFADFREVACTKA